MANATTFLTYLLNSLNPLTPQNLLLYSFTTYYLELIVLQMEVNHSLNTLAEHA